MSVSGGWHTLTVSKRDMSVVMRDVAVSGGLAHLDEGAIQVVEVDSPHLAGAARHCR